MSFERLARELEETARQSGEMMDDITSALGVLGRIDPKERDKSHAAQKQIAMALQAQDRIEQRCRNLASAVRALIEADPNINHARFDEIWASLKLDELAVPELSGIAARVEHGECELF